MILLTRKKMNSMPNNRGLWNFDFSDKYKLNKKELVNSYIRYMLNRTQDMFEYKGLPESIPKKNLELYLQTKGFVVIPSKNIDKPIAMYGGLGGVPNEYYMPTIAIVNNPYLKYNESLKIGEDCIVIYNDSTITGLMPMFQKYALLLAECDLSINMINKTNRIDNVIECGDSNTEAAALKFIEDIENGELSHIVSKKFIDESLLKIHSLSKTTDNLLKLIELRNYIESSWYIDLGLNSNYNMKRERLNLGEVSMNVDVLLPYVENMLNSRREALAQVNDKFGTDIRVDLNSSWKLEHENFLALSKDIEKVETEETPETKETTETEETEETKETSETSETEEKEEKEET